MRDPRPTVAHIGSSAECASTQGKFYQKSAPSHVMQMAEEAVREWIVSPRVNRSGLGDADPP
ncbi:MAG: hypothetical protein U1E20_13850 [Methylocystis sp.]|uniref:hypothetical protein n=1 Tax=Methylocystis sp. TaxID=1911079 RepID=UPI0039322F4B